MSYRKVYYMKLKKKLSAILALSILFTSTLSLPAYAEEIAPVESEAVLDTADQIESETILETSDYTTVSADLKAATTGVTTPDAADPADTEVNSGSAEETEPEEPPFVSPVKINKKADIKLGAKTTGKVKVLYGASGTIDLSTATDGYFNSKIKKLASRTITADANLVITDNGSGGYNFVAVSSGKAVVTVTYQLGTDPQILTKKFKIYVCEDLAGAYIGQSEVEMTYDASPYKEDPAKARYPILGLAEGVTLKDSNTLLTYKESGSSKVVISEVKIWKNSIYVKATGNGKKTVTVELNGRTFPLVFRLHGACLNKNYALLAVKKTVQLKVKNLTLTEPVVWTSSNENIATVSENGLVTAKKKAGTTIIRAKAGDYLFAAAINVCTLKKKKAINKVYSILKVSTYSQPKRMQQGYYDCSSLVWRAFKDYVCNFGVKSGWAPTAASEAYYLVVNKKREVCEWTYDNTQDMLMKPGDLFFGSGTNNGRYRGIDHVETFVGYGILSIDDDGEVELHCKWANRADDYERTGFFARP